mmetsp:Transcript_7515/g.10490  ORF Transcript_7515/g.10490 Transcript_7515/m.10490 type:complete len:238 (-) Transcript_7515:739-1452(-)
MPCRPSASPGEHDRRPWPLHADAVQDRGRCFQEPGAGELRSLAKIPQRLFRLLHGSHRSRHWQGKAGLFRHHWDGHHHGVHRTLHGLDIGPGLAGAREPDALFLRKHPTAGQSRHVLELHPRAKGLGPTLLPGVDGCLAGGGGRQSRRCVVSDVNGPLLCWSNVCADIRAEPLGEAFGHNWHDREADGEAHGHGGLAQHALPAGLRFTRCGGGIQWHGHSHAHEQQRPLYWNFLARG